MKRWLIIALGAVVVVVIAVVAGYRVGVQQLQARIASALGSGSRLSEFKVNWFSIEILGLSIDAPKGWPAARTFEAARITIVPDLRTLFSDQIQIFSIVVEKPYLSMLRNPGKLTVVPSLVEKQAKETGASRKLRISTIELKDGSLDFYDATVSRPPLRIRMEEIEAVIHDVETPAAEKTRFEITGVVKGVKRDGRAKLSGWVGPGAHDSSSRVILEAVDLVAIQPYLIKRNEAQVAAGSLDLNLASEVRNNNLDGKGKVVLRDLELARSGGYFDTFMGLPRTAVINFLKDNHNAIDVDFTLKGNTRNPNFSLNENLSTRIAMSMANQLGVSIRSVAEGLGTLGRKGAEGAGGIVEGVGSTVKRLFGGK